MRQGKECWSVCLTGAGGNPKDALAVDRRDDTDGRCEGTQMCHGVGAGGTWTESCCRAALKECDLDEGPS